MRDVRLGPHRVHGDQRAFQIEMFEQQRDRGDFIRFLFGRLLAQYDALPRCPGGDEVQRVAALPSVMTAPGGLSIDGDDVGIIVAQAIDPGQEAGFEQLRVKGGENIAQRVMAGDAFIIRVEAAEVG